MRDEYDEFYWLRIAFYFYGVLAVIGLIGYAIDRIF